MKHKLQPLSKSVVKLSSKIRSEIERELGIVMETMVEAIYKIS